MRRQLQSPAGFYKAALLLSELPPSVVGRGVAYALCLLLVAALLLVA